MSLSQINKKKLKKKKTINVNFQGDDTPRYQVLMNIPNTLYMTTVVIIIILHSQKDGLNHDQEL